MPKFRIKEEYRGMVISAKPFPYQETITLDTRNMPEDYLFNFWKFQEFRKYIDVFEDHEIVETVTPTPAPIAYQGVEHPKKKKKRNEKTTEQRAEEGSTESETTSTAS